MSQRVCRGGTGYEIELSGVEFEEALHAARGGLRLSLAAHPEGAAPPVLHAGDEVAVLTEARRPQVFNDEGAFDRRAYLAQQNVDLVATLRAPELIERIASSTPTVGTVLARARRRLREEIDELFMPGDAEKQVEHEILSENSAEAMRADVLKIGHHGSKNSTMPEFLAAVRPRVGIISAGEVNPYGHPHAELLKRLEKAGVRILRTDRDGAVHVLTDGARLEITCFVACPAAANVATSVPLEAPDRQQDQEKK